MSKTVKSYWIKERHNPQLEKPYYTAYGQLSKREAVKKEKTLYGFSIMREYKTADEYNAAVEKFKADGFTVHDS